MGVSIAKLPGAKPRALNTTDQCPRCNRLSLVVAPAEDAALGQHVDRFVRCVFCGFKGPLGGLRVVKS